MATFGQETDLVVKRVTDLADLADDAYNQAKNTLDDLASSIDNLPLSFVDVTIGEDLSISWSGTITPVTLPDEPTYIDDALADIPDAPVVPTVTIEVPVFAGSTPGALTDELPDAAELPDAPTALSAPSFGTVPTAPDVTDATISLPAYAVESPEALSDTLADITATLPDTPTSIDAPEFDAITDLGTIPEVSAIVPTIDMEELTASFSFTEPTYTEQISSPIKTELMRVLGGDLGIPSSVWSAMWVQVAGDLARQQIGRLRTARNRGAASYWALPSEAVLAASKAIADEGARSIQLDKLQKAVSEATMKREDFWNAVQQGLALETMWIGFHESMAQRALGAAEQLANVQIQVYNANVQRFNLLLEAAKTSVSIDDLKINRILKGYEVQLRKSEIEVAQTKSKIEHFQAMWEGYKAQTTAIATLAGAQTERFSARTGRGQLAIQQFSEEIKAWTAQTDNEIRAKQFYLEKNKLEAALYETELKGEELAISQARAKLEHWNAAWAAFQAQADASLRLSAEGTQRFSALTGRGQLAIQKFGEEIKYWNSLLEAELKSKEFLLQRADTEAKNYATQYGAIDALANATSALINGRVAAGRINLDGQLAVIEAEKTKNLVEVDLGKLKQAAQESKANIEIAQAEWLAGQAYAMQQRIADLSFGYAQAAVAASQVSLGSSVGMSESIGYDASMNQEKVWSVEFTS